MVLAIVAMLLLSIPSVYAQTLRESMQSGNDAFKQNDFDGAIIYYTQAIDINPNYAKAYNNRGVAYAMEGSMSRAISDFTMAIANNPKDAEAYNNRGHAYVDMAQLNEGKEIGPFYPQAIADFTRAIENNAFYLKAYNNREVAFLNIKEYDKAWADVHTAEAIGGTSDPDFIRALKKASGKE